MTVEYDGLTTAAYLHDDTSAISATWIANHRPAPPSTDQARLDAGRAPLMPAARTKHPAGRRRCRPGALEALWFEEGDGVAILENGRPLAVIAGWSAMDRGMPGYSSDVIGQTPFGWSLDDAMEGLAPRLERSRSYWSWRQSASGWGQFQQALLGHLQPRLGPGGHYWDASAGQQPHHRSDRTARGSAPAVHHLVHGGHELPADAHGRAGARRPERIRQDRARDRHHAAERAGGPGVPVARDLPLARGDLVRARPQRPLVPRALDVPAGRRRRQRVVSGRCLLLDSPGSLPGPEPPDLSGFTFGGDPVRWLWIVPISERDRQLAKERGSASLVSRLASQQRSWIVGAGAAGCPDAGGQRGSPNGQWRLTPSRASHHRKTASKTLAVAFSQPKANITAVPRDHDPDDHVDQESEASEPDRHVFLGSSPNRSKTPAVQLP